MKITIKESSMVMPIQDTPNRRLEVTNLDLFQAKYHVPLLILYRPNGSANFFEVKVLKEALSKVLVSFYPVAGRMARDANGRVEINCNGEGVLFAEAETDSAMDDFVDLKRSDELPQLIPTVDYSDISSFPLLVLQVLIICILFEILTIYIRKSFRFDILYMPFDYSKGYYFHAVISDDISSQ